MSALKDLAANLSAGGLGLLNPNVVGHIDNYNNVVSNGTGYPSISQCTRFQYDWTPFRHYGHEKSDNTWIGFLVNHAAGYTAGATSIAIDGGHTADLEIAPGMFLTFDGCPGIYTVVSGFIGTAGTVTIAAPGLQFSTDNPGPLADNRHVVLTKSGRRFFAFANAHNVQINVWPLWCCYEEATNKWYNLDMYRVQDQQHTETGTAYDPVIVELFSGFFHQDNANAINVAKQTFFRQHSDGSPTIINRVDISPFVPRDIGRTPHRDLIGTLTFTPNSQTVTKVGGTSFASQGLTPKDQIWGATDSLVGDTDVSRYVVTVKSIDTADRLTLQNIYVGPSVYTGPGRTLNPYDLQTHWSFEPGAFLGGGTIRVSGDYWPERDSFWTGHATYQSANIQEKRTGTGSAADWVTRYSYPSVFLNSYSSGDSNLILYNTKRRCLLFAGGVGPFSGQDGMTSYEIRCNDLSNPIGTGLTLVPLDPVPYETYFGNPTGGYVFHCPVCGVYLIIQPHWNPDHSADYSLPFAFYQLDPSQPSGSQLTILDSSVWFRGFFSPYADNYQTADGGMFTAIPDLGVIGVMTYGGSYLYKHCANTRAATGMTSLEKGNFPGVWSSWRWGDNYVHKPQWNVAEELDPLFAAAMAGYTNHASLGDGIVQVYNYGAGSPSTRVGGANGVVHPRPNTSVTYQGQAASMDFTRPLQVGDSVGVAYLGLDGRTSSGRDPAPLVNPTPIALSSSFYMQYPIRQNAAMLQAPFPKSRDWQTSCSVDVAGSNTITLRANPKGYPYINATTVNTHVYIHSDNIAGGWIPGFYTIINCPDLTHLTLDRSPVTSGTRTGGTVDVESIDPLDLQTGNKIDIVFGNAGPSSNWGSTSSSDNETTTILHTADQNASSWVSTRNYLNMYAASGNIGLGSNAYGNPLRADTWTVIDKKIEYRATNEVSVAVGRRGWRRGDWTSAGAGSTVIHSNINQQAVIDNGFFLPQSYVYITGYGGASGNNVNASNWVSGVYLINSVNSSTGELSLATSPTPGGAGVDGEIFILPALNGYGSKNFTSLQVDGIQNDHIDYYHLGSAQGGGHYGVAQVALIPFINGTDENFINPLGIGHTYFGDLTFSGQPIPFETAATGVVVLQFVTTSPLPAGTAGTAYSKQMVAAGGTAPYTWTLPAGGSFPAGLTMSSSGLISGTPTQVGTFSKLIGVTDSLNVSITQFFSITISAASVLTISTGSPLPDGTVASVYSTALSASGGTAPYTWALASGTLPPGLSLSSGGLISGTPTTPGAYSITARVTDNVAATTTKAFSITINSGISQNPGSRRFSHLRK